MAGIQGPIGATGPDMSGFGGMSGPTSRSVPDILLSDFFVGSDVIAAFLPRTTFVNGGAGGATIQTLVATNNSNLFLRQNTIGLRPAFDAANETMQGAADYLTLSDEGGDLRSILLSARDDFTLVVMCEGLTSESQGIFGATTSPSSHNFTAEWVSGKMKVTGKRAATGLSETADSVDVATLQLRGWSDQRDEVAWLRSGDTIDTGTVSNFDLAFATESVTSLSKIMGTTTTGGTFLKKIYGLAFRTSRANFAQWKLDWEAHLGI